VQLKHGALEVLHRIGLVIQVADLGELIGNRVALLGQRSVGFPVGAKLAA